MRSFRFALCPVGLLLTSACAFAQIVPGSVEHPWSEGAADCKSVHLPPLEVHAYNPQTFILRENLCSTFEAPFLYLLIGTNRALLIDTGDVADSTQMPLAQTVMSLLPASDAGKLPLLVVHTHRHLDHRAGDAQFAHLEHVEVVGYDLDSVRGYYRFTDWPNGLAQIDLGTRKLDVIPTPGHNETEVSFYDRNTGLFFSGDFLMPARLLIDDTTSDLASAQRVAAFVQSRPVSYVLGGHIELDANGETFPWESQYHPHEHALAMTKNDLLALPAAIGKFNGFYTQSGSFVMMNSMRILTLFAVGAGLLLIAVVVALVLYIRRRMRRRRIEVRASAQDA